MIARLDLDDLAAQLGDLRTVDRDLTVLLDGYERINLSVESKRLEEFDTLSDVASRVPDGAALADAVSVLEPASRSRQGVATLFTGYLSARFGILLDSASATEDLIRQRDEYLATTETVRATAPPSSLVMETLDAIEAAEAHLLFRGVTDELISSALVGGAADEQLDLASLAVHLDELTSIFLAWTASSAGHEDLVTAAAGDVIAASADARSAAIGQAQRAVIVAGSLAILTVVLAALGTTAIVRPLRRLEQSAQELRDGQGFTEVQPTGPVEVRAAAAAIDEAAMHVDLASRQAESLAAGDLDASVLGESAPGALGAALQTAVRNLADSLGQQDEFRRLLAHKATHDGLTELPNRTASMTQLRQSLARVSRSESSLAVLFIDLDHFKDVNDLHGHHAGDTVLSAVARRLVTTVRDGDHVGRLGGDEFVVIAEPVGGLGDTIRLGERLLEALEAPIEIDTTTVIVGASIGIALAEDDRLTADEILRDADLAVYKAKTVGRGGIELCNEDLRTKMIEEADLSIAIRGAIERDEFRLQYQPIVSPVTGEIDSLEALVRWQRPGHVGLLQPGQFIPFAERSALIMDLDVWVLEHVIRQLAEWTGHPTLGSLAVGINVSGRHLGSEQFVPHLMQQFDTHAVDPGRVILEVTEAVLLDDLTAAVPKLEELRNRGIHVAIDGFGTGYTSLSHLRTLPVDILKVDRSFTAGAVMDHHDESVVKLIIDTGHLLGVRVTVEGIETPDQAEKLADLGSDHLQGFFYGTPQSPDQLERSNAELA